MRLGKIWTAYLNPNKGAEIGKQRPVIIIQEGQLLTTELRTIVTLPLTTQYHPSFAPIRIHILARDRLLENCYAMVEHPCALDRRRLGEGPLTQLTVEEMAALEKSLLSVLGVSKEVIA